MKFTCENCGAQYLIADSKLGERGVKVRCKKCSYVIILRPLGWTEKKDAKEEAPSADIDPSPVHDRPIAAREARERDAVAPLPSFPTGEIDREIGVAPDLGLSQEFAALGFNDGPGELESSPFSMRASGGSLDELPSFNLAAHAGEHASERASSDATDILDRRTNRASLGSSMPDIEDDRVGDPTHVDRLEMEEDTPLEQDGGTGELNAALAKMQRNELLEMRSSLELDLEGLSSAFDPKSARKGKSAEPKSDNHKPDFSALNALADSAPSDPNYNIADEARAEAEITGAFEAMFEVPTDDGFDKNKLPTRVFDTEAMEKVEAEQAISRPVSIQNGQPSEWYVAIDDQQVGPMTMDEVRERWEAGELAADSLCWKQGLGDWQPIKSTLELRNHLGSMEDRERTVVTNLQEEDSVPGGPVPPQISMHPEPAEHPMGASTVAAEVGMDEPSWRPSAASALASLAAEELASSASSSAGIPVKITSDVAVGAALPATSDALEKLLAGGAGNSAAASQFGAMEKSESSVRPLPRRAEAITSMPLRDPMESRSRSSLMLPLSIFGAAVVLVGGIIFAVSGKDDPQPVAMAPVPAQTNVAMVGGPPPSSDAPPPPAAPPAEVAKAAEVTPPPAEVKTEARTENVAKTEEKEEPEEDGEDSEDKEAKKKKGKKKKSEKGDPRPRKEKRELVDDEPPPPTPVKRQKDPDELEVDDLLGPSTGKRPSERQSIEEDLPKQLDDGDILKVLRTNRKAIIDCVKKQATADASVSGTMMVNMVITKAGQTTRITVSPDRYSKTVAGKCVSTAVKNWKFPKFSGPNMPIDFPVRIR